MANLTKLLFDGKTNYKVHVVCEHSKEVVIKYSGQYIPCFNEDMKYGRQFGFHEAICQIGEGLFQREKKLPYGSIYICPLGLTQDSFEVRVEKLTQPNEKK